MDSIYKVYPHNPPHYFLPNAMYMITGSILHKQHLISEDKQKEFIIQILLDRAKMFDWNLQAWAILNNHYHFVGESPEGVNTLSKFIRQFHSITAIQINKWNNTSGRQVWFNYWDTCLTYEKSYYARLHYVHVNPVKHGLVKNAVDYPYCSYKWFLEQGDQNLKDQVFNQPIDKIKVDDDF